MNIIKRIYWKRIALMAFLLMFGKFLTAQTKVTVGDGTSCSEKYAFNGYYDYSWSNAIYKASEIGKAGNITKLAFYIENMPSNFVMNNQKIYARHSTQSSYTTSTYPSTSGYTLVYNGSITYSGSGWKEIVLTTSFNYNGTDNLEFLFENHDGTYSFSGFPYFRVTPGTGEYRIKRDYKDYSFPNSCNQCTSVNAILNIQLTIVDCDYAQGAVYSDHTSVVPGGYAIISITGQEPAANIQWQSSIDNITFTNIGGANSSSHITNGLTSKTYFRAQLNNNGCFKYSDVISIDIDTTTLTSKNIGNGTALFDKYPFYSYYNYGWSSMIYKASEINSTGKLTHIAFFQENTIGNITMNNQKIYVRHTSEKEYTTNTHPGAAGFTLVFDGTITYNNAGWKEIVLTTPFEYNGLDNLEFLFENHDGSYTLEYPIFRGSTNQSEYRVKRDYRDSQFPSACFVCNKYKNTLNVRMKFLPCNLNEGIIAASANNVFSGSSVEIKLYDYDQSASITWQKSVNNIEYKTIPNISSATIEHNMFAENVYYRALLNYGCSNFTNVVALNTDTILDTTSYIGNGKLTTEKFPVNGYYDFSWSNFIYKANEIGKAGQITQLSFYVESVPSSIIMNNQKIWLRHTNETAYANSNYPGSSGFTLVYDGAITYQGTGWKNIALSNFFDYNGADNLEILIENRDGSWASNFPTFRYTSGYDTYRVRRDYSDNTFPQTCYLCSRLQNIPNARIKLYNTWLTVSPKESTICKGDEVQLTASAGDSFSWSPETGLDNPNVQNPIAKPESTTTYTVTATLNGQRAKANLIVNVDETCFPLTINTTEIGNTFEGDELYYDITGGGLEGTYLAGTERKFTAYRPYANDIINIEMSFKTQSKGEIFKLAYDVDENAHISNPRTYIDGEGINIENLAVIENGKLKIIREALTTFQYAINIKKPISTSANNCNDMNLNWVQSKSFAQDGSLLSESRIYSDKLGKVIQTQNKNLSTNDVIVTQAVYDAFGRPAINSLPAPLGQNYICYKDNFLTNNTNNKYSYSDFDIPNYSNNNNSLSFGEVDKPKPVGNSIPGTLGWYYSNNNITEPYVPASGYPYLRTAYNDISLNNVSRTAIAGESHKMGSGHEALTISMPASGELYYVFGFAKGWQVEDLTNHEQSYFDELESYDYWLSPNPDKVNFQPSYHVTKTIMADQNGNENVIFKNSEGNVVASCSSGSEEGINKKLMDVVSILPINQGRNYADIHLPRGCESTLILENNSTSPFIVYNVIDLRTSSYILFNGSKDFTSTTPNLSPGLYRIIYVSGAANSNNGLALKYKLNYYDFTLNYYDKASRLVAVVPPLGVEQKEDLTFARTEKRKVSGFNIDPIALSSPTAPDELGISITADPERHQFSNLKVSLRRKLSQKELEQSYLESKSGIIGGGIIGSVFEKDLALISEKGNVTEEFSDYDYKVHYSEIQLQEQQKAELEEQQHHNSNLRTYSETTSSESTLQTMIESGPAGPSLPNTPYPGWKYRAIINFKIVDQNGNDFKIVGDWQHTNIGKLEVHVEETTTGTYGSPDYKVYKTYKFPDSPLQAVIDPDQSMVANQTRVIITSITGQIYKKYFDDLYYADQGRGVIESYTPDFLQEVEMRFDAFTYKISGDPVHEMQNANKYNSFGHILSSETSDGGLTHYVYRKDGQIRFSENALQRASGKFSYVNYDNLGRVIETGEYTSGSTGYLFQNHVEVSELSTYNSRSIFNLAENEVLTGSQCSQQVYYSYDIPKHAIPLSGYASFYRNGKIAESWNDNSKSWYGYDELGRTIWLIKELNGLGVKTIDYKYNTKGQIIEIAFQKENVDESFYHHYTYDSDGRLINLETSEDGLSKIQQAKYLYYRHGSLKRVEIAGDLQGTDYVYTINAWLKSMNDPTLSNRDMGKDGYAGKNSQFANDIFGIALDYFSGDYRRSNTYIQTLNTGQTLKSKESENNHINESPDLFNGNLRSQRWQSLSPVDLSYKNNQLAYTYKYDNKSQIIQALFGTLAYSGNQNGTGIEPASLKNQFIPSLDYKVWGINYDANGNLIALNRNSYQRIESSITVSREMDQFKYKYLLSDERRINNKLLYIEDAVIGNSGTDIKNQLSNNYTYDAIGQLLINELENLKYEYDYAGKTLNVKDLGNNLRISYTNDEAGFNIKKTVYDNSGNVQKETWYLRDGNGSVVSIYSKDATETNISQIELPVYSSSRIGMLKKDVGNEVYIYEISDQTGNVRATYTGSRKTNLFNGFESNGIDEHRWKNLVNSTVSTEEVHGGYKSIKLRMERTRQQTHSPVIEIPVKNGHTINVSVYYKYMIETYNSATLPDAGLRFELFSGNGSLISSSIVEHKIATSMDWNEINASYNVSNSGTNLKLKIYAKNMSSDPVWFDDLAINITAPDNDGGFAVTNIQSTADYYPFGSEMPGRTANTFTGNDGYRYGYQGKFSEKDAILGWNEFEARNWDARLGRWTNPDPAGQFHSPYLGMGNNPVFMIDPDGRFAWTPVVIGGVSGGYGGYQIGKSKGAEGWAMAKYITGGAAVGAVSGYLGYDIANSGGAFANTLAIASASMINSVGMYYLSGTTTDITTSFGVASYTWNKNELRYLGKEGNSKSENISYSLGAIANISDLLAGLHPASVELQTENLSRPGSPDIVGHFQLNDGKGRVLIDFGPTDNWAEFHPGRNDWIDHSSNGTYKFVKDLKGNKFEPVKITGANINRLYKRSDRLNTNPGFYNVFTRSCSSVGARALTMSGVPVIGLHPYLAQSQLYLRSIGVRPTLYSYFLLGY